MDTIIDKHSYITYLPTTAQSTDNFSLFRERKQVPLCSILATLAASPTSLNLNNCIHRQYSAKAIHIQIDIRHGLESVAQFRTSTVSCGRHILDKLFVSAGQRNGSGWRVLSGPLGAGGSTCCTLDSRPASVTVPESKRTLSNSKLRNPNSDVVSNSSVTGEVDWSRGGEDNPMKESGSARLQE
jgi:hypothetical protein